MVFQWSKLEMKMIWSREGRKEKSTDHKFYFSESHE